MLQLVGAPGIGKTMISSYLIEELDKRAQFTSGMIFAYYFCDNKDDKRNTAIAIIRGLLLQLLRQRPLLFKHIQEDYDQMRDRAFDNFDALWRILLKMLRDPHAGQIYILIDALDECDKSSRGFRQAFLENLAELFPIEQGKGSENIDVKLLITCRPESDISDELIDPRRSVRIDSSKINADLWKYIQTRVNELSTKKKYPSKLKQDIQGTLSEKAGGTFLWVSLILKDISETTVISKVRTKLQSLPSSLSEVYSRILNKIQEDDVGNARFILQWVVTARRPLTIDELAMARALGPEGWDKNTIPTADALGELNDGFKFCEPLVYLDDATQTINLVHQSAKDYLLEENLQGNSHLSMYRIIPDKANSCILDICWRYLSMEEFSRDIMKHAAKGTIRELSQERLQTRCFLQYAIEEWQEHALAASPAVITDFLWESDIFNRVSLLRDHWLQRAAGKGDDAVVRKLLMANANVNAAAADYRGRTALQAAAGGGHLEVVERLLAANADVNAAAAGGYGRTALQAAAGGGHLEVVERLLAANANVNAAATDYRSRTALQAAAGRGHLEVVERLLAANANVNAAAAGGYGRTALQAAAEGGHLEVVERLLAANANVNAAAADDGGRTALQAAAGHEAIMKVLQAAAGLQ